MIMPLFAQQNSQTRTSKSSPKNYVIIVKEIIPKLEQSQQRYTDAMNDYLKLHQWQPPKDDEVLWSSK